MNIFVKNTNVKSPLRCKNRFLFTNRIVRFSVHLYMSTSLILMIVTSLSQLLSFPC